MEEKKLKKDFWNDNKLIIKGIGSEDFGAYGITLRNGNNPYNSMAIKVITNPFANCQTYTIADAHRLTTTNSDIFKRVITLIRRNITKKTQVLIDIEKAHIERTKEQFEYFSKGKIKEIPYKSTNGSRLSILIIKLDEDKIDKYIDKLKKNKLENFDKFSDSSSKMPKVEPRDNKIGDGLEWIILGGETIGYPARVDISSPNIEESIAEKSAEVVEKTPAILTTGNTSGHSSYIDYMRQQQDNMIRMNMRFNGLTTSNLRHYRR